MPEISPPRRTATRRLPYVIGAVLAGAALGYAGVSGYGNWTRDKAAANSPCAPAVETARRIAPLVKGEVAALTLATAPMQVPNLAFNDSGGAPKTLRDFSGKTVLLNLWATWCVPCRQEMPALNDLQAKLGGGDFQVVAINIDTRDAEKPKAFLADAKLTALDYFTDRSAKVFQDLKSVGRALGMPTSVLIDGKGCELATISGPAEWNSGDAVRLIQAAIGK